MNTIPENKQPLDLEKFLTYTAACVRNFGYISSQDAQEKNVMGTGELAWEWATKGRSIDLLKQASMNLTDRQVATDVAKWMGDQSYFANKHHSEKWREIFYAKKIFWNETVYATSAFAFFTLGIEPEGLNQGDKAVITEESKARAIETVEKTPQPTLEDAIKALMSDSPIPTIHQWGTPTPTPTPASIPASIPTPGTKNIHLGVIGQGYGCQATLVRIHGYQGRYGEGFFYNFQDQDGNWLVWSTNKTKIQLGIDVGSLVWIRGTIKKHSDWKGTKQTEITRCTVKLP